MTSEERRNLIQRALKYGESVEEFTVIHKSRPDATKATLIEYSTKFILTVASCGKRISCEVFTTKKAATDAMTILRQRIPYKPFKFYNWLRVRPDVIYDRRVMTR